MNLYEIRFKHYAPKDSEEGMYTYLIANSDEEVYEWLKSKPELKNGKTIFTGYGDDEKEGKELEIFDENYNVIGTESFKEKMIRLKGDMNDDDVELTDLYYGRTLFGWRLIKEGISEPEINFVENIGISLERV